MSERASLTAERHREHCLATACPALYLENGIGGEARGVVAAAARELGIDLSKDVRDGDVWSPANMQRVIEGIESLRYQLARYQGTLAFWPYSASGRS